MGLLSLCEDDTFTEQQFFFLQLCNFLFSVLSVFGSSFILVNMLTLSTGKGISKVSTVRVVIFTIFTLSFSWLPFLLSVILDGRSLYPFQALFFGLIETCTVLHFVCCFVFFSKYLLVRVSFGQLVFHTIYGKRSPRRASFIRDEILYIRTVEWFHQAEKTLLKIASLCGLLSIWLVVYFRFLWHSFQH